MCKWNAGGVQFENGPKLGKSAKSREFPQKKEGSIFESNFSAIAIASASSRDLFPHPPTWRRPGVFAAPPAEEEEEEHHLPGVTAGRHDAVAAETKSNEHKR